MRPIPRYPVETVCYLDGRPVEAFAPRICLECGEKFTKMDDSHVREADSGYETTRIHCENGHYVVIEASPASQRLFFGG